MAENDPILQKEDLFYTGLIRSTVDVPGFVRRDWLGAQVAQSLTDPGCRFLLLTAEPGAGKTTLMAWLADQNPGWLRYFIRRDSKAPLSSGDARSCLFALGHQLAARRPALFRPGKLEVYIQQEIAELKASGRAVGIQVEDLRVSPFYQTALRVEQHVQIAAGELVGISIKHLTLQPRLQETGNLQYLALIDPARALLAENAGEQIVILINALDELRYRTGGETILDWLAGCPELPANVRFVLTSRPDPALLDGFCQGQERWLRKLAINPEMPAVQDDLRRCAQRLVTQVKIGRALAQAGVTAEAFAEKAAQAAGGNFQCLTALINNLEHAVDLGSEADLQRALALEALPGGLSDIYAFYVRQVRRTVHETSVEGRGAGPLDVVYLPAWEGLYQPLLGLLAVAREPFDPAQLQAYGQAGVEARWVTGALSRLAQFLKMRGNRFRLYHNTFIDFLTGDETAAAYPDCYLNPHEWHRKIVAYYIGVNAKNWSKCDSYGLNNLVDHVIGAGLDDAGRAPVLDEILTPKFIEAVLEHNGWLFSLVEDMEVLARIEPARAAQFCMRLIFHEPPNSLVIQRCLRLLVRLWRATRGLATAEGTPENRVEKVIEILSGPPAAVPDLLAGLLEHEPDLRVRGAIALALAESGDTRVTARLMEMLRKERGNASWAAADGLVALNDRSIIPELVEWYQGIQSKNDQWHAADKWRILYILGWMHAEEAQVLKQNAWSSNWPRIVGRGIDLTWLLKPAEGDTAFLLERIHQIAAKPPEQGPWANKWVQKRLVRALSRLMVTAALPDLRCIRERLNAGNDQSAEQERLADVIEQAIAELEARTIGG